MDNCFGHLLVQELFQKGYFTSVFKAYDESQNKGVLLQIITPIFSSNKRYNQLLADYAHKMESQQTSGLLPISNVLTDSDRVGVVYDLPTGLSSEWGTFSSLDTQTTAEVINICQKSVVMAFSWLEENNILHRALRPDSIAFHEASNQAFLTLCGHFEALFYLEAEQNPAYHGQFQANFYKTERIGVFKNYDINDEYYSFAKTWYFLDMLKNQIPVKTIDSNLQALSVSAKNPMAEQLNVFLGGDLQAKQQTFSETFQIEAPPAQSEEKQSDPEPTLVSETKVEDTPPVIEENPKVVFPPFEQPPIIQGFTVEPTKLETEKEDEIASPFPWKKYAVVSGGFVVFMLAFVFIYSNLSESKVESANEPTAQTEHSKELNKQESLNTENEIKSRVSEKIPKIEEKIKETKSNSSKPTVINSSSGSSVFLTLEISSGIYQLDELSKLIDQVETLSLNDRKLLTNKTNSIYTNLPKIAGQLTSSDQRKLCNYRSKFENHLRRNGIVANASVPKNLDVHCN